MVDGMNTAQTPERDFKGVWIPREIWLNKDLTLLDKAIMVEIDSLDKGGPNGCFAGNEHFAEMFGCTARKVSDAVSKLIKSGYVRLIRNDGRRRYLRSCMKYAFQETNTYFGADENEPSTQTGKSVLPRLTKSSTQTNEIFHQSIPYSIPFRDKYDDDDDRAREEQDINPYGESDYRPVKGTIQRYATENLKYMSPRAMEELNDFVDDLGEDLVRHGINNALDAGANTWSYVKAILNRYVDEGIKTVGEAKAYDEKFKQSRREKRNGGRQYGNNTGYTNRTTEYARLGAKTEEQQARDQEARDRIFRDTEF